MITKEDFKTLFETWEWIVDVQTEGLSRQDLLIQPQPGGNCMLWVLGHMVVSMKDLIQTMGGTEPEGYQGYERFERNSQPVLSDEPGLPELEQIKTDFIALSKLAAQTLDAQDLAFFAQPGWSGTNGATVLFLAFHMSFHAGQLEYLRNLAGKTEKVI
jgi:hypothetical protein